MPKMTYVKDPVTGNTNYVRVGSLATEPPLRQWRKQRERLRDCVAPVMRVGAFIRNRKLAELMGEYEMDEIQGVYSDLEILRWHIDKEMAYIETMIPLKRRIELLENVKGREPAEAEMFRARAAELRRRLEEEGS